MRRERAGRRRGPGNNSMGIPQGWYTGWFRGPGAALLASCTLRGFRGTKWLACMLASPFFAKRTKMSFAGLGNPPLSPPGRAPHCAPAGGYMRREKQKLLRGGCRGTAWAPLRGGLRRPLLVPFHTSPLSRGALRSAGVPTIAASTTSAPLLPWPWRRGPRGIWEDSAGAREYPVCAEGWALWVTGGSPYLLKATGGTYGLGMPQGRTSPSGLLLGRLGGDLGALTLPAVACRRRSGEFRRGKRM